jgi:rubredoxin
MVVVAFENDDGTRRQVDRCDVCGAVFIEYFDGEPGNIARALHARDEIKAPKTYDDIPKDLRCPDCRAVYDLLPYLDKGPHLYRCSSCMAVFATPRQLQLLAAFLEAEPAPSWFARLLDALSPD